MRCVSTIGSRYPPCGKNPVTSPLRMLAAGGGHLPSLTRESRRASSPNGGRNLPRRDEMRASDHLQLLAETRNMWSPFAILVTTMNKPSLSQSNAGNKRPTRRSIGIRELKAKASSVIEDVKGCRVAYAVTKRGVVEALIVPVDAGERLLTGTDQDSAWNAWQTVIDKLAKKSTKKLGSASAELRRMRR